MKTFKLLLGISFSFLTITVFPQWTTDPSAPLIVGNAANIQSNVQSMPDGSGGLLTFWRDSRTESGKFDIYGQHYNGSGIAQWTPNGKLIIDGTGNILSFHVIRSADGHIIIGWIDNVANGSPENGIFAQSLNLNGAAIWPSKLTLKTGNSHIAVTLVESAGQYYACMQALVIGGADKIYMNKFTDTGSLLWPIDEHNIVYSTGDIGRVSATADNLGGLYVYYSTGNGSGASLLCNHLSGSGPASGAWSDWINITTGSAGLNYQFSAIGDSQGITLCWVGGAVPNTSGVNIYSKRLLYTNGGNAWSGGTREICVALGNQDRFYWKKSGNEYFITWADSRPGVVGNSAIYARKFNTAGILFWAENGVEVANLNTYIPNPEFDLDENNTMVICHKASPGFMAHKVLSNGTVQWGPEGELVFINSFSPFYGDFNMVYSGGNYLAISAKTNPGGGADGIYLAKITVQITQISQTVTACNSYTLAGEEFTDSGTYTINLSEDTVLTLDLTIYDAVASFEQIGNELVSESAGQYQWFDCDAGLPIDGANANVFTPETNGNYALIINNGPCADTSACVSVVVSGLMDRTVLPLQVYPNPGSEFISITIENVSHGNLMVSFYDIHGRAVHTVPLCVTQPCKIYTNSLVPGAYILQIQSDEVVYQGKWVKM